MEEIKTVKPRTPLFGNGRFFGFQFGNIDDRLEDPYSSDVDVVKYLFDKRVKISKKDKKYGTDTSSMVADSLAKKINEGSADEDLIPYLDSSMENYLGFRLRFYEALLSKAETEASIPYLLQALESTYEIRDKEPFEIGNEVRNGEITRETSRYMCRGYKSEWYEDYHEYYERFEQEQLYHVNFPFAEMAKERLEIVLEDVTDLSKTMDISQAMSEFEERKKKTVSKTCVLVGRKIGEEQVGWHN